MATFPIDIIVNPRGAVTGSEKVGQSLDRLEDKSNRLASAIKKAFAFIGAGLLVREITQLTDTYTNLQNRIKVVTDGQRQLVQSTDELFESAQRTRSSFQSTVELYSRLRVSSQALGKTNSDVIKFTEALNKAIILSGSGAVEAAGAITQLSQGIGAGALRGQELNSILEQTLEVAKVIADELGVTVGELKTLGEQGKISANIIFQAFANASDSLTERFQKTIPTLSQSFQVLQNAAVKFFGEVEKKGGTISAISRSIIGLSQNLETIADTFKVATITTIAYFAAFKVQSILAAIAANIKYSAAIASGRAVALGSAEAERQKAIATLASAEADVAATTAAITRIGVEVEKAVVIRGSAQTEFATLAILKQSQALKNQLTAQTVALTAAQANLNKTTIAANSITARLSSAFPGITAAVRGLWGLIAANPFVTIAVLIAGAVAALTVFADKIKLQEGKLATLADASQVVWGRIKKHVEGFIDYFDKEFPQISIKFKEVFGDIDITFQDVVDSLLSPVNKMIGLFIATGKATEVIFEKGVAEAIPRAFNTAFVASARAVESGINDVIEVINAGLETLGALKIEPINLEKALGIEDKEIFQLTDKVGSIFRDALDKRYIQDYTAGILTEAEKIAKKRDDLAKKGQQVAEAALQAQLKSIEPYLAALAQENRLLALNNEEREIQSEILKAEKQLQRELSESEKNRIGVLVQSNLALKAQNDILENIIDPVEEYKNTLQALNRAIFANRIDIEKFNAVLAETQVMQDLAAVKTDLFPLTDIQELQSQLDQRLEIIDAARKADSSREKEYLALSLEARRQYNAAVIQAELQRAQIITSSAANTFESLTALALAFGGETSSIYKRMFALAKAFAIADSSVKILMGIANAFTLPFPSNLAAVATVAAASANIVSNIQAIKYSGAFQNGGSFRVGGSGGTDSQMVAIKASPNETVSVRTPGQEQAYQRGISQQRPTNVIVNVNNNAQVSVATQESVDRQGNAVLDIWIEAAQNNTKGVRDVINSAVRR